MRAQATACATACSGRGFGRQHTRTDVVARLSLLTKGAMMRTPGRSRIQQQRRAAPALILLFLACHSLTTADPAKAGSDVLDALRANGEAQVMIALVSAPSQRDPRADPAQLRAEVARLQAEVLNDLDSTDYRSGKLFEFVPAMSGTVHSQRGLSVLLAHRNVRRVDLDTGGGGSGVR